MNAQNAMNGWTALHWAAKRDHPAVVTALLNNGANPSVENAKNEIPADLVCPHPHPTLFLP